MERGKGVFEMKWVGRFPFRVMGVLFGPFKIGTGIIEDLLFSVGNASIKFVRPLKFEQSGIRFGIES
jgi:hypothetical protein